MYTKEQIMKQICRYLQQERSCVTARWICRNFGVSRAIASSVLCDVLDPSKNIFNNNNNKDDEFLSFFSGNTLFEVTILKEENSSDKDGSKKGENRRKSMFILCIILYYVGGNLDIFSST